MKTNENMVKNKVHVLNNSSKLKFSNVSRFGHSLKMNFSKLVIYSRIFLTAFTWPHLKVKTTKILTVFLLQKMYQTIYFPALNFNKISLFPSLQCPIFLFDFCSTFV
jgi:hypothetical protein